MKIQAGTSQSNTTHRAGIILSEDQDDQFIMEYDGRGSDSGNFLTFYSAISGWVGHGQGFCYVPANGR